MQPKEKATRTPHQSAAYSTTWAAQTIASSISAPSVTWALDRKNRVASSLNLIRVHWPSRWATSVSTLRRTRLLIKATLVRAAASPEILKSRAPKTSEISIITSEVSKQDLVQALRSRRALLTPTTIITIWIPLTWCHRIHQITTTTGQIQELAIEHLKSATVILGGHTAGWWLPTDSWATLLPLLSRTRCTKKGRRITLLTYLITSHTNSRTSWCNSRKAGIPSVLAPQSMAVTTVQLQEALSLTHSPEVRLKTISSRLREPQSTLKTRGRLRIMRKALGISRDIMQVKWEIKATGPSWHNTKEFMQRWIIPLTPKWVTAEWIQTLQT